MLLQFFFFFYFSVFKSIFAVMTLCLKKEVISGKKKQAVSFIEHLADPATVLLEPLSLISAAFILVSA